MGAVDAKESISILLYTAAIVKNSICNRVVMKANIYR